jgi:hypothetical protein
MVDANVPAAQYGIQDTKEVLIAMNELGLTLLKLFADGVQFQDFLSLWKKIGEDQAFKDKLAAAYEGYKNVSGEITHLDVPNMLVLVSTQMEYIPLILASLGKPKESAPAV